VTTPLVLVAASGLAREVMAALPLQDDLAVRGVLDDAPNLRSVSVGSTQVIGTLDDVRHHTDALLLICAGKGRTRAGLVERLARLGVGAERYATFIHPTTVLPTSCTIGHGSLVLAGTVLTADVRVGHHVVLMPRVTLTHDDVVEDFATLCAGVSLGGSVRVGTEAYLGMNSSIREHTTVGARAVLGMGAVLLQDLPADQTWTGVPARPLRTSSPSTPSPRRSS
jgi:sugar O-acyltransferase (sialic acid O-acetyltransferase NeuD family)